jgi:hypothetical protein
MIADAGIRYSLQLIDTVKIGKNTSTILTDGCTKITDIVMELAVSRATTMPH